MRTKLITLTLFAIFIALYFLWNSRDETNSQSEDETHKEINTSINSSAKTPQITKKSVSRTSIAKKLRNRSVSSEPNLDQRVIRYTDGSVDLTISTQTSSKLHQNKNPEADLEIISQLLSSYRTLYKTNPIGVENFEFTAALTGKNPKQVNFIDPNSPALSNSNELVDRWGSPIVFHPLSGTQMELRSLGPDKILWTEDDIELKP